MPAAWGYRFVQSCLVSRSSAGRLELESDLVGPGAPVVLRGADFSVEQTAQPVGFLDGSACDQRGGLTFCTVGKGLWVPWIKPRSLGLFAQLSWTPMSRLTLRGGVRNERVRMAVDDFTTLQGNQILGGRLDFDPALFNVVRAPAGTRAYQSLYPVHIGHWGGTASRVPYSLFGLTPLPLFVSVVPMWRNRTRGARRRRGARATPAGSRAGASTIHRVGAAALTRLPGLYSDVRRVILCSRRTHGAARRSDGQARGGGCVWADRPATP